MVVLLYFDETQNVNVKLISARRLMRTTQKDEVLGLHYVLRFVKVKQQTLYYILLFYN